MKFLKIILLLVLSFQVFAIPFKTKSDYFEMGQGANLVDKTMVFDTGDGVNNPSIIIDDILKDFTFNGDITTSGNNFSFGDSTNVDKFLNIAISGESVGFKWDEASSQLLQKKGPGLPYEELGAGAGGARNYIENEGAELTADGWSCSTGNMSIVRNTTTPLIGDGDFQINSGASAVVDDYCSYSFTLEIGDSAKKLKLGIESIKYSANYESGDFEFVLFCGGSEIQDGKKIIETSGEFVDHQQTPYSTSTQSCEARFLLKTDGATRTVQLNVDNISIGRGNVVNGTPSTKWDDYTPTITGFGTPSSVVSKWRRDGSDLLLNVSFVSGIPTAVTPSVSLPPGLSADYISATSEIIGVVTTSATSATYDGIEILGRSTNQTEVVFGIQGASSNSLTVVTDATTIAANGRTFSFDVRTKIQGWKTNVQMSETTSNRNIYVEGRGNDDSSVIADTTDVKFTKTEDYTGAYDGTTFTASEDMEVQVEGSVNFVGASSRRIISYINGLSDKYLSDLLNSNDHSFGGKIKLKKGQTLTFRASVNGGTLSNSNAAHHITIQKASSGSQTIAQSESILVRAAGNGNTLISGDTTDLDFTEIEDSHGLWDGSVFTSPRDDVYSFNGAVNHTTTGSRTVSLYKGAVHHKAIGSNDPSSGFVKFSGKIKLLKGETASLRESNGGTLTNLTIYHHLVIENTN
jgi:hypothetical protein